MILLFMMTQLDIFLHSAILLVGSLSGMTVDSLKYLKVNKARTELIFLLPNQLKLSNTVSSIDGAFYWHALVRDLVCAQEPLKVRMACKEHVRNAWKRVVWGEVRIIY